MDVDGPNYHRGRPEQELARGGVEGLWNANEQVTIPKSY